MTYKKDAEYDILIQNKKCADFDLLFQTIECEKIDFENQNFVEISMIQIEGKVYIKYDEQKTEKARELISCMELLYPPGTMVDLSVTEQSLFDL